MKKLLAVAVLAMTTTAALAGSDRAIYDIQYLPNAGTTYGFTEFQYEDRALEADTGDNDITGWRIGQTIGHAFTDRLSVQADVNYFDGSWDPQRGSKIDQNGLSDIGLNARFRMMDEAIRLDLIGGVQISHSDGTLNGNRFSNNYENGGNRANLGVQVGERGENHQWAVSGRYIHAFDRTIEQAGAETDIDGNDAVEARADLLNHIAEKSFIRSHFTADFIQKTETDKGASFRGPQSNYELGAEYQHLMSQDLLVRGGVDYRMSNYDSASVDSDDTWVYRIAANYQF